MMTYLDYDMVDRLYDVILRLETKDECRRFFADLCTERELRDLSHRMEAARLLDQGWSYYDIHYRYGMSMVTISKVCKCLFFGADGYRRAMDKIYMSLEKK